MLEYVREVVRREKAGVAVGGYSSAGPIRAHYSHSPDAHPGMLTDLWCLGKVGGHGRGSWAEGHLMPNQTSRLTWPQPIHAPPDRDGSVSAVGAVGGGAGGRTSRSCWFIRTWPASGAGYHICHTCRIGRIDRVWIAPRAQRQGLGREILHEALAHGAGYCWVTSRQSSEGRSFFAAMSAESGILFQERGLRCTHMRVGG